MVVPPLKMLPSCRKPCPFMLDDVTVVIECGGGEEISFISVKEAAHSLLPPPPPPRPPPPPTPAPAAVPLLSVAVPVCYIMWMGMHPVVIIVHQYSFPDYGHLQPAVGTNVSSVKICEYPRTLCGF